MAGPPDRAFAHMRISEERRTPSPFPMHKADLRVDLSTLNIPAPQQHSPQPSNVIPIPAHHVVIPPRPSPQLSQEPPSVPSVISPRLSPRAPQDKGNSSKYTFHFPPPITNPFGGSTQGFPTTYQLDSALPAKGEQSVIFFPVVHAPTTPPLSHYGSPASPQLSPRGPRQPKDAAGRTRAQTEGPPISPRGSSSSSQSSNPTSPRNRRANSLSPQKPSNPPYPVFKMRVMAGKLEDVSKPRNGRTHRRVSPHSSQSGNESLPESDPALDLPFPAPPGLFQICQPDTHPDFMPHVPEEPPLNFLEDVFLKSDLAEPIAPLQPPPPPEGEGPMRIHPAPLPMEWQENQVVWSQPPPPAAAEPQPIEHPIEDFWPT